VLVACVAVIGFRIESGIAQDRVGLNVHEHRIQKRNKPIDIGAGATADQSGKHQMARAIEGRFELGVATVSHGLPLFCGTVAASDVVQAAVTAVQAGRVEGDPSQVATPFQETLDRGLEESARPGGFEEPVAGLLEGGKVRHGAEAQMPAQGIEVPKQDGQAAVIGFEKGLQDQAGEELWLRVFFGAVPVRVEPQAARTHSQGNSCHRDRRLAEFAPFYPFAHTC